MGVVDGGDGLACVGVAAFIRGGVEGRGDVVLGRGTAAIGEIAVVRGGAVIGEAALAGGEVAIGGGTCTIWSTSISGATPEAPRVLWSVSITSSESGCIGTLCEEGGAETFFSGTFVLGPDSLTDGGNRLGASASSSSLSSMTMTSGVPFLTFGRDFCPSPVFFLIRGTTLDEPTLLLGLEDLDVALGLGREDGSESEEISITSFCANADLFALPHFSMLDNRKMYVETDLGKRASFLWTHRVCLRTWTMKDER